MSLPKLLLVCAGSTMDDIARDYGGFDAWFGAPLGDLVEWTVCHAWQGQEIPDLAGVDGFIISGSPSSCTAWEPWMDQLAATVEQAYAMDFPTLGVCFGHQLMGATLGGCVQRNPAGREIGTVDVVHTLAGTQDRLLGPLFPSFRAQATHVDSVVSIPAHATVLAQTAQEHCAAMRFKNNLYGVQFHPELSAPVIRRYISLRAKEIDSERGTGAADRLHAMVQDTRAGETILKRFVSEVMVPSARARAAGKHPRVARKARNTGAPRHSQVAARDGAAIHVEEVGKASPTLMMMDGVGCDGYAWKYLSKQLQERHHILHAHYPGHGQSPAPSGWPVTASSRLTIGGLADDAATVMDATGVEKAVLFGHSLGVQVALETWRRHPTRVAGLVLVCGSPGRPLSTFHGANTAERIFPLVELAFHIYPRLTRKAWRTILRTELAYQVAHTFEVNADLIQRKDLEEYFEHLARVDPLLFLEMVRHANSHSATHFLHDINVPTLIVAGQHDTFTPAHLSQHMHNTIPGSELLHIPLGTHTAPVELPELLGLRVEKFLQARLPSPAAH